MGRKARAKRKPVPVERRRAQSPALGKAVPEMHPRSPLGDPRLKKKKRNKFYLRELGRLHSTSRISFPKSIRAGSTTMMNHAPVFAVTVNSRGVVLERIKRKHAGYRKSRKEAVLRQRDAIELFRKRKTTRRGLDGKYTFLFLDTAKTFAVLCLQARESSIQDNLDRVLAYDGSVRRSEQA